ncbi:MAG: hypothetical protein Q7K57_27015 [Burkholderiaceae bacterium]|nr:hypothetical protein [Burkholderiaceae bacterium]
MSENIDEFNQAVGLIFAKLYGAFPEPIMLKVQSLDPEDIDANAPIEDHNHRWKVFGHTMMFLRDEGYVRFNDPPMAFDLFPLAVLTRKGLEVLNQTPESINGPRKTIGDTLRDLSKDILKEGAKEALKGTVGLIFGAG